VTAGIATRVRAPTAGNALRMELTKLRTVPSTAWSLVAVVGLTVMAGALLLWALGTTHCGARCDQDLPRLSLGGVYVGQVAVVVIGVVAITSEYDTLMIRTTLAACPRRLNVLAAKAAVVGAAVLAAAVLAILGTLAVGRLIPTSGYPQLSLVDDATRRAYLGTVLYLCLIALFSLGVGALLRNTAGAITTMMALLYVAPIVAQLVTNDRWRDRIERHAPLSAGLSIQATRHVDQLPIRPWVGLGVLAVYAVIALLLGAVAIKVRDA